MPGVPPPATQMESMRTPPRPGHPRARARRPIPRNRTMKPTSPALAALLLAASFATAAEPPTEKVAAPAVQEIPLYPGVAPGSEGWDWEERSVTGPAGPVVTDVVRPVLLAYPAEKGRAVGA